ncbi:MAG: YhcH/YjgK/YiaL family protein, partial [Armatimonadetes bacterium]|nr:YhcH/YjgK/YiaL family protein [Armatimonadota bacterium]
VIVGLVEDWIRYFGSDVWKRAFEFILSLDKEAPEETIELLGQDMTARVMSYQTVGREDARLEAHREHVDIQASLQNDERIDWFPLRGLIEKDGYDRAKDVIHYECPAHASASVCVGPGMFAVLYPEDAHMPKLITGQAHRVKKVVLKLHVRLLGKG